MQLGISDLPAQINRNIVYDIVCNVTYDMKPRTYDVLPKMYDVAYDISPTTSYVQPTKLYVAFDIVRLTNDIVHCDIVQQNEYSKQIVKSSYFAYFTY